MVLCIYVHIMKLYVINRSDFFFFIKLAIICINNVLSIKAKAFCSMPECLVSGSAEHSVVQNLQISALMILL